MPILYDLRGLTLTAKYSVDCSSLVDAFSCARISVAEVAEAGEGHGDAQAVGGGDDFWVFDGAARLDDGRCACFHYGFEAVGEGKKGVGGGYAAGQWEDGFHG